MKHSALLLLVLGASVGVQAAKFTVTVTYTDKDCSVSSWSKVEAALTPAAGCTAAGCTASGAVWTQVICLDNAIADLATLKGPKTSKLTAYYPVTAASGTTAANPRCGTQATDAIVNNPAVLASKKVWEKVEAANCPTAGTKTCANPAGAVTDLTVVECEDGTDANKEDVLPSKIRPSGYTVTTTFLTAGCSQDRWSSTVVKPVKAGETACKEAACAADGTNSKIVTCLTGAKTLKEVTGPVNSVAKTAYKDNALCASTANTFTEDSKTWTPLLGFTCTPSTECKDGSWTTCETKDGDLALSKVAAGAAATGDNVYPVTVTFSAGGCSPIEKWSQIDVKPAVAAAADCKAAACTNGTGGTTSSFSFCFTSKKLLRDITGPNAASAKTTYADADSCNAVKANLATAKSWTPTCATPAEVACGTGTSATLCEKADGDLSGKVVAGYADTAVKAAQAAASSTAAATATATSAPKSSAPRIASTNSGVTTTMILLSIALAFCGLALVA